MSFEEKLIAEVARYDCLYNLQSANYKNVLEKERIWQTIAIHLDQPAETCRKRWKSLRDRHKRQKNREQLPSGSGAPEAKRYKYYEQLAFLDEVPVSRPTISNFGHNTDEEMVDDPLPPCTPDASSSVRGRTPSTRSRSAPMTEELQGLLEAAQTNMVQLTGMLNSQAFHKQSGTSMLMESLAERIQRCGFSEQELLEVEERVSSAVFCIINEVRARRSDTNM